MKNIGKVILLCLVLLAVVVCVKKMNGTEPKETQDMANELYGHRNPFIGDASADDELLYILQVSEKLGEFTTELETDKQPYILRLVFKEQVKEEEDFNHQMKRNASLLLALIENADKIDWRYENQSGETINQSWSTEDAQNDLGIEDIKNYCTSRDKVQELLDR